MWISQSDRYELSALWDDNQFCLVCARPLAAFLSGESRWFDAGVVGRGFVSVVPCGGYTRPLDWNSVAGTFFRLWFCRMGTFVPAPVVASIGMRPNEVNVQRSELSWKTSYPQSE